ncbi:acyltransferase [Actinoplanes sp. NPDC026623]|uniref:acyltransferase family protein n=1 Tax=Actinoplanes sp. NPDC026623 TaxID=3155610 RepID=UPI0033F30880
MTPASTMRNPAAALAAATPAGRDRYVDLLRVVSLGVVIAGHWLMAVPVVDAGGTARVTNVLALVPALRPATWLLQVMPVFFLVGGFAHATALASIARRGGGYPDFVRSRTARLLRPTAVFAGIWLALALAAALAGRDHGLVRVALRTVVQPLWFLGVYLGLVALAPAMWRLHRRFGAAVPAALLAAAAVVDVLCLHGHPGVAVLNLLIVWAGVHQLGFLYADGTLQRGGRRLGLLLAGGGLTAVILLTTVGPYPVSMVGVPGEKISNMSPPTVALAAHAVWLVGLVLLLREPATAWLRRARVWRAVVAANGLAMTAFLWHLSAAFVVLAAFGGRSAGAPGSAGWWATRPLWLGAAALVTAVLVCCFRRFDTARPAVIAPGPSGPAAAGSALCTLGVLAISTVGFGGLLEGRTAQLLTVPVTAPVAVALVALGAGLLRAAPLSHPRRP